MQNINAPKYAFYYLLSLVALIFTAISTGMIFFQIINKNLPDLFGHYGSDFSTEALKFAISAIIIATPIFYIVSRLIYKSLFKGSLDKDAGIRRWLTYFILFVTAVVIIVSLIMTILSFLNGELTGKFIFKVLTVIGISAITFSFYLYDIRRAELVNKKDRVVTIYTYGSLVIILVAFICSLFIVESPQQTRNRRVDDQIINNFYSVESNISGYYQKNKVLPADFAAIKNEFGFSEDIYRDPQTSELFEYQIVSTTTYQLCANFRTSNVDKTQQEYRYLDDTKRHNTGRQCLNFKIYPELIKEIPAIKN